MQNIDGRTLIVDLFTKFVLLHSMRKAVASKIVKIIESEVFLVYGVLQVVIVDNRKQFIGNEFKKLCGVYKVGKIRFTPKYHAQANPVERYNRTVETAIRCYVGENHKN